MAYGPSRFHAKKSNKSSDGRTIEVDGQIVGLVHGTREELADLKELLDEVIVRCYDGNRKELLADLAEILEDGSCAAGVVLCREVINDIEEWARDRLQAIDDATVILSTLDWLESNPDADAWATISREPSPLGTTDEEDENKH